MGLLYSSFCFKISVWKKKKVYRKGAPRSTVFSINSEILLPENAPLRLTSAQLEELDYEKLYRAYSPCGRKSKVDPLATGPFYVLK